MTFREKLARLTDDRKKNKIAARAGMSPAAFYDLLHKNHTPRAATALRVARALGVDLDWLIDDSQDWPPVGKTSQPQALAAA